MDEKTVYIINIGDFVADGVTYTDRCLSASYGGQGVASEVIPWECTDYQPWDYHYTDEDFVLEPIEIAPVEDAPTPQEDTDAMLVDHELRISLLELFGGMNDAL